VGGAIHVRAYRKNGFVGEIQLSVEGLPPGVKATCGRILAEGQDGVILFTRDKDAKLVMANVRIIGTATIKDAAGKEQTITAVTRNMQETYMPGGGRGLYPVDTHTIGTANAMDILSVKVTPTDIKLKPGESQKLDVVIQRAEGFDKNVTLDVTSNHLTRIYGSALPPGVTIETGKSKLILNGKTTEGSITLKAAPDAKPVDGQVIPVIANVALNFVMKMGYAAEPVRLSITAK
jgi:hypothetical protein